VHSLCPSHRVTYLPGTLNARLHGPELVLLHLFHASSLPSSTIPVTGVGIIIRDAVGFDSQDWHGYLCCHACYRPGPGWDGAGCGATYPCIQVSSVLCSQGTACLPVMDALLVCVCLLPHKPLAGPSISNDLQQCSTMLFVQVHLVASVQAKTSGIMAWRPWPGCSFQA
jgi:hypothetical protein